MKRALDFEERLKQMGYYERVKFTNKMLGPDWIFRLEEVAGRASIEENRPSWVEFYVGDRDRLHLPLDPRAPQTDEFLTEEEGIREFALFCGLGFDGYLHALNTKRRVDTKEIRLRIGDLIFDQLGDEILEKEDIFDSEGNVPPEARFRLQSEAHESLFAGFSSVVDHFEGLEYGEEPDEEISVLLDNLVVATPVAPCNGHQGCGSHATIDEANQVRLESIVMSLYIRALAEMDVSLDDVRVVDYRW